VREAPNSWYGVHMNLHLILDPPRGGWRFKPHARISVCFAILEVLLEWAGNPVAEFKLAAGCRSPSMVRTFAYWSKGGVVQMRGGGGYFRGPIGVQRVMCRWVRSRAPPEGRPPDGALRLSPPSNNNRDVIGETSYIPIAR